MESVPKIVHQRLEARAVTVDHPDPDVLTAFSERSLPRRERAGVLEHLAGCAECRQVVALSLPAEESALPAVRPLRDQWLTWPRLRWGMMAAGVIVVASWGALRYRAVSHPGWAEFDQSSKATEMPQSARNQLANQPEPLAVPKAASSGEAARVEPRVRKGFDGFEELAKLEAAPKKRLLADVAVGPVRPQALSHAPKPPVQQGQQTMMANSNRAGAFQSPAPSPAAPRPFARDASNLQIVAAQASPSVVSFDGLAQNQDTAALNARSVTSLPPFNGNSGGEVARAKPAETTANAPPSQSAQSYAIAAAEGSNFSPSGSLTAQSSRWAINPAGGLERSLDQGKTWQEVNVNAGTETPGARARVAAQQKSEGKPKPIVFRAVAANGPDVWAGGSEGNLYHSADSGDHWVKVVPSWRGIELSGDILSLQFADVMHGRIVTSASEIWTTPDDGQSWAKQ